MTNIDYIADLPTRSLSLPDTKVLARRIVLCLVFLLLSACNQQQAPSIGATQTLLSKTGSANQAEAVYGRKAEFSYPEFSGAYPVASSLLTLTDPARLESFEKNSIDNRRIQIRFYYPALANSDDNKSTKNGRLPVISEQAWEYLVGHQQRNGKKLRYENYRQASWDISINTEVNSSRTNFPVLIFSHGYGFNPESYSAMSAELASQGFIIVSINHTYGANPTDFGNNDVVWAKKLMKESTGAYLPIWSDDQRFVMDQLSLINADPKSLFYQKLDLVNLGIFGHSYGGAAAYHTASSDPRIKAVLDLDGTIFDAENTYIQQPFAFVLSHQHSPNFNYSLTENDAYEIRLKDFEHITFTDNVLWWQWDFDDYQIGLGRVNANRAVELTSEIVSDFFTHYLLDSPSQLFQSNELNYKELHLAKTH